MKVSEAREQQRFVTSAISEKSLPILAASNAVVSHGLHWKPDVESTVSEPEAKNLPPHNGFFSTRPENPDWQKSIRLYFETRAANFTAGQNLAQTPKKGSIEW